MSVAKAPRFGNLPEEIEIMIAIESITLSKSEQQKYLPSAQLKQFAQLSLISPIFQQYAQAAIFHSIYISTAGGMRRLTENLKLSPRISNLVKEIGLAAGDYTGYDATLEALFDECAALHSVDSHGGNVNLSTFTRIKELKSLSLWKVEIRTARISTPFKNLTSLHFHSSEFQPMSSNIIPANFPSLNTLTLVELDDWITLKPLFPQIINLSLFESELIEFVEQEDVLEQFKSLKRIEFYRSADSTFITRALSQITSPLSHIRLHQHLDPYWNWTAINELITEGNTTSILNLKSIYVPGWAESTIIPSNHNLPSNNGYSVFKKILPARGIDLGICLDAKGGGEVLEYWLERVRRGNLIEL